MILTLIFILFSESSSATHLAVLCSIFSLNYSITKKQPHVSTFITICADAQAAEWRFLWIYYPQSLRGKVYTKELKKGASYKDLKQTISINILDYNMFDCEECHSIFQLREATRNELLTDKCRFDFLELPKANTDSRQIKRLRRWLNFFNVKNEGEADMIAQANDKVMNKAVFILKQMSADEKIQEIARIRERALHDEASYLADAAEKGRAEGRAEERNAIIFKLRKAGMAEETIQSIING